MAQPPRIPLGLASDPDAPVPAEDELLAVGRLLTHEIRKNEDLCERVLRVRRAVRAQRHPDFGARASAASVPQRVLLHVERDPKLIVAEVASKFYKLREPVNRRERIRRARTAQLCVLALNQEPMCKGVNNLLTLEMVKEIFLVMRRVIRLPPGQEEFTMVVGCMPYAAKCELIYGVVVVNTKTGEHSERLVYQPLVWQAIVPDMTPAIRMAFSRALGGAK